MARIVVADDEPKIVSFVSRALTAQGFEVEGVHDGRRTLERVLANPPDLVVLDLLMPGLDGVSVLKGMLRAVPEQRVLVLSALGDVETKVRCLDLGAADYLTKPFALSELVARVRARLRQPARTQGARTLRARGVTLDLTRHAADAGAGPVPLSAREFLLLQHLMRRAGHVCKRDELLSDVWGYSFDPGTNIVDVYVRRIRAKLGGGVIETVRSVGYRIRAEGDGARAA